MSESKPQRWTVTVENVPGQGWGATLKGDGAEGEVTWENSGPHCLMFDVGAFMADHAARPEPETAKA